VPLGDLPRIVGRLRDDGRRAAVVTTDDRAPTDATLRALGIRESIGALVCGDDGFALKPEPDPVFAVCHAFQTEPAHIATIGDTPADIAMGRAAGAGLVIGVRSGISDDADLADADVLIDSIGDLVEA